MFIKPEVQRWKAFQGLHQCTEQRIGITLSARPHFLYFTFSLCTKPWPLKIYTCTQILTSFVKVMCNIPFLSTWSLFLAQVPATLPEFPTQAHPNSDLPTQSSGAPPLPNSQIVQPPQPDFPHSQTVPLTARRHDSLPHTPNLLTYVWICFLD